MPSPFLKKISRETGKSEKELEKYWSQAKEISSDFFGIPEKDFGEKEYGYASGIVKQMAGIKEHILDVSYFLDSDKSAKDFVEQEGTVISGEFDIGNVIPPSQNKEPYEDEDSPGIPKQDGSGQGNRSNAGRGNCDSVKLIGQGQEFNFSLKDEDDISMKDVEALDKILPIDIEQE